MAEKPEHCVTCTAYRPVNPEVGLCCARPPVPIMVGFQERPMALAVPGQQQQAQPLILTYFPQIPPHGWCREWIPIPDTAI